MRAAGYDETISCTSPNEHGKKLAATTYRQALAVYTREALPQQWTQTHHNLAKAYMALKDWSNAAASYANVIQEKPIA